MKLFIIIVFLLFNISVFAGENREIRNITVDTKIISKDVIKSHKHIHSKSTEAPVYQSKAIMNQNGTIEFNCEKDHRLLTREIK